MYQRLLDRFVLTDVRNLGRSLQVPKAAKGKVKLRIEINFVREHEILIEPPEGTKQGFAMVVTLDAQARNVDDEKEIFFSGSVKLRAVFASVEDEPLSEEGLASQANQVARFIYPIARMEIFRLFAGAKLVDAPIPWDLGSEVPENPAAEPSIVA